MNIKFHCEEDKYSFESENMKITFSNPSMQAWDEYGYCKNKQGILYYYYGIDAFIKQNKKWKKVFEIGTFDFPQILVFEEMLKIFIGGIVDVKDYQRIDKENDNYWLLKMYDLGAFSDDYYAVKHEIYMENSVKSIENFEVIVGKPLDIGCSNVQSIAFKKLTKSDLEVIHRCVKGFIDYTIQKNNEIVINRNKKSLYSWVVKDGKLYEMSSDGKSVVSVYVVGDFIDGAKVLCGDINSKDFYSIEFNHFVIDEIVEDGIVLSSGYEEKPGRKIRRINKSEKICIYSLLDLFKEVPEDKLAYNEEAIIHDFMSILSESEKEEFRKESIDFLYNKWNEAIIDRTWMCRDEHNLPKREKDTGNHENVYASVYIVVKTIQNNLI